MELPAFDAPQKIIRRGARSRLGPCCARLSSRAAWPSWLHSAAFHCENGPAASSNRPRGLLGRYSLRRDSEPLIKTPPDNPRCANQEETPPCEIGRFVKSASKRQGPWQLDNLDGIGLGDFYCRNCTRSLPVTGHSFSFSHGESDQLARTLESFRASHVISSGGILVSQRGLAQALGASG